MATPDENDAYVPTLADLRANGAEIPEDAELAENTDFQPADFEGTEIEISAPIPAIVMRTREGLFQTFSLFPIVTNRDVRKFEIQVGEGSTPDEAKKNCLAKTSEHMAGVLQVMEDYQRERAATEYAGTEVMSSAFTGWTVVFKGKRWCNTDTMPPDAYEAHQRYIHLLSHGKTTADPEVQLVATEFQEITRYSAASFQEFLDEDVSSET